MRDLAIYGAGGFGRETALHILQINTRSKKWSIKGFYDDGLKKGQVVDNLKVLGGFPEIQAHKKQIDLVIAIADPLIRKSIAEKLSNPKIDFPSIIHPACLGGAKLNSWGRGCILTAGVILTTGIELGDFVIINLASTVGHDVKMGQFVSIMPGCNISGNVRIGEGTMLGTGAQILQNLSIGRSCKVGAGAVVTKSFGDNKTIIGIPAREK
jgi:sugar O-acyltransferase (sialic acid O-acetyltransferase NeuD family)